MTRGFQAFALVLILTFTAVHAAQMRVDVRLVNVIATVTDHHGRYLAGLGPEDFVLEEDGARQKISHFSQDHGVPVSVGILLDTSGSMERKIQTAVEAVDRFVRRVDEEDEIFLMTFASEPVLRQDFTNDRDRLSKALRKIFPTGGTSLYDALTEALVKIENGRHDKRAILVITDGQDTSSVTTLDQVLRMVRESELLVYSIGIRASGFSPRTEMSRRDEVDMKVLHAFAESSGGRAFLLSDSLILGRGSEIEKVLDTVADELHSQYTIGYYPSHPDDGRYHSIELHTTWGYPVRSRGGYIAGGSF